MYKIRIKDLNELARYNKNLTFGYGIALNNAREYVNNNIKTNFPYHFTPSYDLLVMDNNQSYLVFNPRTFMESICELLEIDYIDASFDTEIQYNIQRLENRIIELKNIKDENELMYKFPNTYQKYKTRLEKTRKAVAIYNEYRISFPKVQAYEQMRKNIYTADMNDQSFNELLYEAPIFNWRVYIEKVIYDARLILGNVNIINGMISNILLEHTSTFFDQEKIKKLKKH